jgi:beta-galactosidase
MFDFGADARAEGGENGQNHKGLVTMDRKYKKDAFYAYKAWLRSPEDAPFVHLCSKRYIDRVEDVTKVTVYSNLPEVELFANGVSLGKKTAADHFFYFEVENKGETKLEAVAGEHRDESVIRKVDTPNEDYVLKEQGAILNWFDVDAPEGRYSLNDKISDIRMSFFGKIWFIKTMLGIVKKMPKNKNGKTEAAGFEVGAGLMEMMGSFTVLRLTSMMGMANVSFTKEELLKLNKQLNKIRKHKSLR